MVHVSPPQPRLIAPSLLCLLSDALSFNLIRVISIWEDRHHVAKKLDQLEVVPSGNCDRGFLSIRSARSFFPSTSRFHRISTVDVN